MFTTTEDIHSSLIIQLCWIFLIVRGIYYWGIFMFNNILNSPIYSSCITANIQNTTTLNTSRLTITYIYSITAKRRNFNDTTTWISYKSYWLLNRIVITIRMEISIKKAINMSITKLLNPTSYQICICVCIWTYKNEFVILYVWLYSFKNFFNLL